MVSQKMEQLELTMVTVYFSRKNLRLWYLSKNAGASTDDAVVEVITVGEHLGHQGADGVEVLVLPHLLQYSLLFRKHVPGTAEPDCLARIHRPWAEERYRLKAFARK